MSEPHSLPDILAALESNAHEIEAYFGSLPRHVFFSGDDADWGPAHHLSHLTLAHKRVGKGLADPESLPPHQRGRSRTLDEMRAAYESRMAQVPPEQLRQNPLPPKLAEEASQRDVIREFVTASARLRTAAAGWSEGDCDARAMPHPFMGWVSTREMLLFFVFHDRMHHEGVRRRFGEAHGAM